MHSELRLAARRLLADRWTTLTAVVTVALGAGVAVAVFAIGFGLLMRPLPYDSDGRLSLLDVRVPIGQIDDWRRHLGSFDRLTAYAAEGLVVRGIGDTRVVRAAYVDAVFFQTLMGRPRAGRVLAPNETSAAVVSERFAWAAGIAPEALVGRTMTAGGTDLTIVGVLPQTFAFPAASVEIWIPASHARPIVFDRSPDARRFRFAGWLRPGVTAMAASIEAREVSRTLQPEARDDDVPVVEAAHAALTRESRSAVLVFAGAASVLWIVTGANLATILIGRIIARRRELAVCDALGAGLRRRSISVLSESLLITLAGTALGVLLAFVAVQLTVGWAHDVLPRPGDIRLDAPPLVFAALSSAMLALVATVLALPTLRRRTWSLHARDAGVTRHDRRLRGTLLVSQVALVVVLVSSGALLVRTLAGLLATDLGLDGRHTLVSQLVLTPATRYEARDRWPLLQELLERARRLPGVRHAGVGSSLPPDNAQVEISVRFTSSRGEESHRFSAAVVTHGYLEAIGARLLQGRHFEAADVGRPPSVILSESAARAVLEGTAFAGRELPFSLPGVADRRRPAVIGVVADIRYSGLEAQPDAAIYVPWHLAPMGQGFLAIRTDGSATRQTVSAIRTQLRDLDPALPHMPMRSFDEVVERSIGVRRIAALLGATMAALAFGVALVGLAGSVLRAVEERRRELAIRSALGATPTDVIRLVTSSVVALSAVGLIIGTAGAIATGRVLRTLVAGVGPYDGLTLITVAALVLTASVVAAYLPARLAGRINPADALKAEA